MDKGHKGIKDKLEQVRKSRDYWKKKYHDSNGRKRFEKGIPKKQEEKYLVFFSFTRLFCYLLPLFSGLVFLGYDKLGVGILFGFGITTFIDYLCNKEKLI